MAFYKPEMKSRVAIYIGKIHPVIWQVFCLLISVLFLYVVLANRSPNILRPLSISLRTGFGIVIPAATLAIYLAFRIPGRIGELVGLTITMALFAMPLAGLWASGQSQTTVLSGLIPFYDAESYYIDSLRLIDGMNFSTFSARRPLFAGLFSVLLWGTGQNLMASLAILTFFAGLSCYLAAREIQNTHGAIAAVFVLMILFLFYRLHSGVSMSENLGVALGALGFGMLWRGSAQKKIFFIWFGLMTTTVGLNARAGAFFILPLLIMWSSWLFRDKTSLVKGFIIFSSAVILGFAFGLTLTRWIAEPGGIPFSNFSYSLYGLASGGKSWYHVVEVHPEILSLSEPELSKRIYQLAFELMREKPLQTVQGMIFNWKMLFSDSWYSMYSYVGGESWVVNTAAQMGMYALCLLGIIALFLGRKDPIHSMMILYALGVFISVPFLPPTDAYRMRPYAASIAIFGALPALGLNFLIGKLKRAAHLTLPMPAATAPGMLISFTIFLISLSWLGPLLIKTTATTLEASPIQACPPNMDAALINFDKGTYISIHKQDSLFLDWMPDFHIGLFKDSAHSMVNSRLIEWAESVEPPRTLLLAWDHLSKTKVLPVIHTSLLTETGVYLQLCGHYETDETLRQFGILNVESVEILRP